MRSRSLFGFDIWLLASVLALMTIGVLFVYSSGVSSTGVVLSNEYVKQIIWVSLGIVIVGLLMFTNYSRIADFSPYIYGVLMLLLVATLFFGHVVNGARSWIPLFGFGFQPSEFAKIGTILFLAYYLDRNPRSTDSMVGFVATLGITLLPVLLVLLQNDMGTALVYLPVFLVMAFIAGFPLRYIAFLVLVGGLMIILGVLPAWHAHIAMREYAIMELLTNSRYVMFASIVLLLVLALAAVGNFVLQRRYLYWTFYASTILTSGYIGSLLLRRVLKDHQISRLIVFLDPGIDPQGAGWNVIQSVTAVGSGGLRGKGWLQGTQSHYRFLPQQSTDFIFSILAEEWGFVGGLAVFALFAVILARGLYIMMHARDRYAALVCAGIVGMIGFHVLINIGMTMGIMPITGIPLFFLSYGGSSLWTALVAVGLMLNIHIRRYRY